MKEETTQPYFLNPKSDKYYKGYRYEKDEDGYESWYDESNVLRRRIYYDENDIKYTEYYYNENFKYHNEDGPAYIEWRENGEIETSLYYLNGDELIEDEWKEKTNISFKFQNVVNEYIKKFETKHDLTFDNWVGDEIGEVAVFNEDTYYVNFNEIRYDIDNNIESSLFKKWYFETMEEAQSNEKKYINYKSYVMGLRYRIEIFFNNLTTFD